MGVSLDRRWRAFHPMQGTVSLMFSPVQHVDAFFSDIVARHITKAVRMRRHLGDCMAVDRDAA
eukprot:8655680-Alexandrium_andersonii.AAC.1